MQVAPQQPPAGRDKAEEPGKVGQHAGRDEHRRRDEDQHAVDDRFSGPPAGVEIRPQACQRADALLPGQRRADDPRAHDEPDRADGAHALADLDEQGQLDDRYGDFFGHTTGNGHKNVELRTAQHRASFDESTCLQFARGLVSAKIQNCRTLLRRNWKRAESSNPVLVDLKSDGRRAARTESLPELLGVEGTAAARYFRSFGAMLQEPASDAEFGFDFETRNRRPPKDPVNALLSFAYSLLVRAWTVTLASVGFDAYRGLYHQPRYGRPALALDLMEPFRPLLADSVVVQAINNGEVRPTDFKTVAGSVNLGADGRRRFISTFERRLGHEVVHPLFGYRVSYRRLMEMQARLFGRFLLGELPEYPNFTTR